MTNQFLNTSRPTKADVCRRLEILKVHGFIKDWREENRWFYIDHPMAHRWYSLAMADAWLDGAEAMGAGNGLE